MIRREGEEKSPFHDLNGFQYRENWLENFNIASSLGERRLSPSTKSSRIRKTLAVSYAL